MPGQTVVVLIGLALAGSAVAAPPRFDGTGQLQHAPSAAPGSRFSLRAALQPLAPRPDAQTRFLLAGRLEGASAKAVCVAPDRIFGNGFESP